MVDWTDLPHEIFISIFIHLFKKRDIAQCQITCHHWRQAAEQVLYREVILIRPHTAQSFIQKLQLTETGKRVKIIRIFYNLLSQPTYLNASNTNNPTFYTRELFSSIARYCPYLEIVDTCHNPEPLWRLLLQESKCWKYIKEIPKVGWDGGNLNTYFDTALLYRATLQSLYLGDRNYFTGWDNGPKIDYLKIAVRLAQFTSLTHLEIQFATTAKTVMVLEALVNACPLLVTLKFTPTFYDQSRYLSIQNPLINIPFTTMHPHFHLKTFEGMGVQFTNQSTDYFISKFPHLHTLFLKQFLNGEDVHLPQHDQVMAQMARHISALTHVNIYNSFDTDTMARLMQEFLNIASLETLVQIQYDDYDVHHSGGVCYPYLVIRKNPQKNRKLLLQVHFKSYTSTTSLPHAALLQSLVKTPISELHLHLGKKVFSCDLGSQATSDFHKRMGRSFHQLTRCSHLQTLQLHNINLRHVHEKKCCVNKSVHTLLIAKDDDQLAVDTATAGLEMLSRYFIGLKRVYFDIRQEKGTISIKMQYSRIDDMHWKVHSTLPEVLLFVHEIMNSSKSWFSFTRQGAVREITNQEFINRSLHRYFLRLQVQCYSLKTFTVQFHHIYKQCTL